MHQTLFALAALLSFSIYMVTRHGTEAEAERFAITAEVELLATDVATLRLAEVLANAYDEADRGREGFRTHTDGLSAIGSTDPDEPSEAAYDDVDDYHGVTGVRSRSWHGTPLQFTDSVAVRYVDPDDPSAIVPAGDRTLAKEVSVIVFAAPVGYIGTPQVGARLQQVVTPASQAPYR